MESFLRPSNVIVHAYRERPPEAPQRLRVMASLERDALFADSDRELGMRPPTDSPGAGFGQPLIVALTQHVETDGGPYPAFLAAVHDPSRCERRLRGGDRQPVQYQRSTGGGGGRGARRCARTWLITPEVATTPP